MRAAVCAHIVRGCSGIFSFPEMNILKLVAVFAQTEADHLVSTEPPPQGWGRIQDTFKAFADRGIIPKWMHYRDGNNPVEVG